MKLSRTTAILAIAALPLFLSSCGVSRKTTTLQVGSYNIRYENKRDSLAGNGWGQRCPVIASQVIFHDFEIFGTQEGKYHALQQLKELL